MTVTPHCSFTAAAALTALAAVPALTPTATAAPLTFNQVALTGDVAPGTGGAEFIGFVSPALNAAGEVAFEAFLRTGDTGPTVTGSNDNAIFGPTPSGGLGILAREGDGAPDAGGAKFSSLGFPALNAAGGVAFQAFLRTGDTGPTVSGDNDNAIFGPTPSAGGSLGIVAREDNPAPDAGGAEFDFFNDVPALNAAGDVAFRAVLRTGDTGPTVDFTNRNRQAICGPTPSGGLGILAREGDPAPDAGGAEFSGFVDNPALNTDGDVAFRAFLRTGDTGPAVTNDNQEAIFGPTPSGGFGILAREDAPAPDADGAEFSNFSSPALNAAGDVAFSAVLRTGDTGPTVTSNNEALFGPTPSGGLGLLARADAPAPGAGGAEFSGFNAPALNAAGDVAFLAVLQTGDTGPPITFFTNNAVALYVLVDGEFQLVVREGDLFTLGPADAIAEARTISGIGFNPQNGLSDTRQLAFELSFTDGTAGIFTTNVPEPASLALLAAGLPLILRRRRRA